MENVVLTIGGLIKSFDIGDAILLLIGLIIVSMFIYIFYLLGKTDKESIEPNASKKETTDIQNIIDNLEANYDVKPVDLSEYEQELEDTAIISYEELLKRTNTNISYGDSYASENKDVIVKKAEPTDVITTKKKIDTPKNVIMNYEDEEAFLEALRKLQSNLVR